MELMKEKNVSNKVGLSLPELWRAVLFFLEGHEKHFVFWLTVLSIGYFWGLVPALVVSKVVDVLNGAISQDSLILAFGLIIFLGAGHAITSLIRLTAKNKLGDLSAEAVYQVRVKGFERLVDYSLEWHDEENTGNKVQKIQNGASAIRDLREMMTQMGIETIIKVVGIFAIFIFLNPFFVAYLVVYLGIFFAIHLKFYSVMERMNDDYNKSQESASGTYYEGVNNILTIKTLGVRDTFKSSVFANEETTRNFSFKMRRIEINKWKIFQVFNGLSIVIYLSFTVYGVYTSFISIGQVVVLYSYLWSLIDAAGNITDIFDRYITYNSAISRMMPIYWNIDKVPKGTSKFPSNWSGLIIKNGHINFGKTKKNALHKNYALNDLFVSIKKNEKIGVAGLSGSGKSTFAKVLMGLYKMTSGSYKIDKTDFYKIDEREVVKCMTLVLQESEMFNMSVRDNITLLRKIDEELLQKAISIAQLEHVINKLPQGLDTQIGEKGHRLSGGERQRIGIARAICKDPEILILDESTSSLDTKTETLVQEALEKELTNKTVITIAHRISTLRKTDRVLVFEKGKIVEQGRYDELLGNDSSVLSKVYKTQQKQKS